MRFTQSRVYYLIVTRNAARGLNRTSFVFFPPASTANKREEKEEEKVHTSLPLHHHHL